MKIKQIGLAAILLSLNSIVFAANDKPSKDSKKTPATPKLGDKEAPYKNPNRFVVEGSFIYWQAYEDGLEYALTENANERHAPIIFGITDTNGGYTLSGAYKDKTPEFKWDPGFKLGVGVVFGDRDEWDLFLNWTWLKSKANGSLTTPQPLIQDLAFAFSDIAESVHKIDIIPSWGNTALGGPAASARSHWLMHYNTIDLELGRNFFISKNVTLRPHIGLRAATIHQSVKANYDSIFNSIEWVDAGVPLGDAFRTFSNNDRFKGKNDFDGVGLRGGFDTNWNFLENFAFYGKLSGAILYGRFDVHENFKSDGTFSVVDFTEAAGVSFNLTNAYDLTIDDNYHRIRSTLQAAFGFTWHTGFNDDKQHLFISLGYEFNEWFQQNELRELIVAPTPNSLLIPDDTVPPINVANFAIQNQFDIGTEPRTERREGDLGLQGLTFDVRFDF